MSEPTTGAGSRGWQRAALRAAVETALGAKVEAAKPSPDCPHLRCEAGSSRCLDCGARPPRGQWPPTEAELREAKPAPLPPKCGHVYYDAANSGRSDGKPCVLPRGHEDRHVDEGGEGWGQPPMVGVSRAPLPPLPEVPAWMREDAKEDNLAEYIVALDAALRARGGR